MLALPTTAHSRIQETKNKAHETVVDGRWEVKPAAEQPPKLLFEF